MKVQEKEGAHIFTVTVDCNDPHESGDHPPINLSSGRGDMVVWETADGSPLNVVDIQKARPGSVPPADIFNNADAPDPSPFPQPVPMRSANGKSWGPATPVKARQTYKYTIEACGRTFDPHIIVGP